MIHVVTYDSISSLFMAEEDSIVYTCHVFFIQSCVEGHLGRFHVLATLNNAVMDITFFHIYLMYYTF